MHLIAECLRLFWQICSFYLDFGIYSPSILFFWLVLIYLCITFIVLLLFLCFFFVLVPYKVKFFLYWHLLCLNLFLLNVSQLYQGFVQIFIYLYQKEKEKLPDNSSQGIYVKKPMIDKPYTWLQNSGYLIVEGKGLGKVMGMKEQTCEIRAVWGGSWTFCDSSAETFLSLDININMI